MNIFIAGVYGVGKSYLCNKLSERVGLPHYSSSSLIKHGALDKSVNDVGSNQEKLIAGLELVNKDVPTVLLDGHFVILSDNEIKTIEKDVFRDLNLKKIILLELEAESILERLKLRGGQLFNLDFIQEMQAKELCQAQLVSAELNIPLLRVASNDGALDAMKSFIEDC